MSEYTYAHVGDRVVLTGRDWGDRRGEVAVIEVAGYIDGSEDRPGAWAVSESADGYVGKLFDAPNGRYSAILLRNAPQDDSVFRQVIVWKKFRAGDVIRVTHEGAAGFVPYVDESQITEASQKIPYVDGSSTGAGISYAWTGTADASDSSIHVEPGPAYLPEMT